MERGSNQNTGKWGKFGVDPGNETYKQFGLWEIFPGKMERLEVIIYNMNIINYSKVM